MDVQMPVMNGFDATAAIRSNQRASGRTSRSSRCTAHAMEGDRERCLAAGMDEYVTKPLMPEAIRRAMIAVTMGGTV